MLLAAGAGASAASGCAEADTAPPVATVSFSASKTRVPLGSPVVFTYKFEVAPDAKIPGDYRVFVHVKNEDGATLWTNDHQPPTPTSSWQPGQTIEYSHRRFVPRMHHVGEATVEMGLHRDSERLPLRGPDTAESELTGRSYKVGTLQLLPESENVFLQLKSGWHPEEFSPEDPSLSWQWTQKTATITFRHPGNDINFYIEHDARLDLFSDQPQRITVYSGQEPVHTFVADTATPRLEILPITKEQLGTGEMVELRLDVDRTFVPARLPAGGRDARELGLRVYHVFVESR